jgi:hypothetical protein
MSINVGGGAPSVRQPISGGETSCSGLFRWSASAIGADSLRRTNLFEAVSQRELRHPGALEPPEKIVCSDLNRAVQQTISLQFVPSSTILSRS